MTASLQGLSFELIERICKQAIPVCPDHESPICEWHDEHDSDDCGPQEHICPPHIILLLRQTCQELNRKTMRLFKSKWFTSVPVIADVESINILLQISLDTSINSAVRQVRFDLHKRATYKESLMSPQQLNFLRSGSFKTVFGLALTKLPNCSSIILSRERSFLGKARYSAYRPNILWQSTDGQDEDEYEELDDISVLFRAIIEAMASSKARVTEVLDSGDYTYVSLDKLHQLSRGMPCSELQLPFLQSLSMHVMDVYHVWKKDKVLGSLHQCDEQPTPVSPCANILGCFLSHLPILKCLDLFLDVAGDCWVPKSFGLQLKTLTLLLDDRESAQFADGGRALVSALRATPKLKELSINRFCVLGVYQAKSFFTNLTQLSHLQTIELIGAQVGIGFKTLDLCLTSRCPHPSATRKILNTDWKTSNLAADLNSWRASTHTHSRLPWSPMKA